MSWMTRCSSCALAASVRCVSEIWRNCSEGPADNGAPPREKADRRGRRLGSVPCACEACDRATIPVVRVESQTALARLRYSTRPAFTV